MLLALIDMSSGFVVLGLSISLSILVFLLELIYKTMKDHYFIESKTNISNPISSQNNIVTIKVFENPIKTVKGAQNNIKVKENQPNNITKAVDATKKI